MIFAMFAVLVLQTDPNPPTGVLNSAVTQATIGQTICNKAKDAKGHDWIFNQRPPASWTDKIKSAQLPPGTNLKLFEEDHIMAISDGGAPHDPNNLRPQAWDGPDGAKAKDHQAEDAAHALICSGKLTLAQGQAMVRTWINAHHPYPKVLGQ